MEYSTACAKYVKLESLEHAPSRKFLKIKIICFEICFEIASIIGTWRLFHDIHDQ